MTANATATEQLQRAGADLLSEGKLDLVIGYGRDEASQFSSPVFVRKPEEADRLVFDDRCFGNLAVYLSKDTIRRMGKIGIVVAFPVSPQGVQTTGGQRQLDHDVAGLAPWQFITLIIKHPDVITRHGNRG